MRIRAKTRHLALALLAASAVALALPGTLLYLKHRDGELGGCLIAFLVPFLLAGVGLALLALREIVGLARYGTWELECPDGGGRAGEPLPVTIHPGRRIEPNGPARLTLRCVETATHQYRGSAGSETRTESNVLGKVESAVVTGPFVDPRSGFAATLEPPAELPGSRVQGAGAAGVLWQLIVEVPGRRGDAHVTFDVPMRGATGADMAPHLGLPGRETEAAHQP
jgi:hypothetical protein